MNFIHEFHGLSLMKNEDGYVSYELRVLSYEFVNGEETEKEKADTINDYPL